MKEERTWLDERAALTPNRIAVTCGGVELRYAELAVRAHERARHLRSLGVHAGDAVAVLHANGLPSAELLFAIDLCGAALVPLNTRLTARELAHPLHDCGANVLLHGDDELAEGGVGEAGHDLARGVVQGRRREGRVVEEVAQGSVGEDREGLVRGGTVQIRGEDLAVGPPRPRQQRSPFMPAERQFPVT